MTQHGKGIESDNDDKCSRTAREVRETAGQSRVVGIVVPDMLRRPASIAELKEMLRALFTLDTCGLCSRADTDMA